MVHRIKCSRQFNQNQLCYFLLVNIKKDVRLNLNNSGSSRMPMLCWQTYAVAMEIHILGDEKAALQQPVR